MKHYPYDPAHADALAPLLDSIGHELEERGAQLTAIEARIEPLRASGRTTDELRGLEGEAAVQRRELRHCRDELEQLGCSVVGTTPLTIRIPTRVGDARRSRVWQQDPETSG